MLRVATITAAILIPAAPAMAQVTGYAIPPLPGPSYWDIGIGVAGALGTLVGVVALVLYLRDRRRVEVRYEFINDNLIGQSGKPLPDGITIHYKDVPLSNLWKTNFVLWNKGTQAVKISEFSRPLNVVFPEGCKIFGARMVTASSTDNRVTMTSESTHTIIIGFDYLSVGQGFNFEFLYSTPAGTPHLEATLIDNVSGLMNNKDAKPRTWLRRWFGITNLLTFVVGAIVMWFALNKKEPTTYIEMFATILAVFSTLFVSIVFGTRQVPDAKTIPKALRS